jgi:TonB family protein
MDSNKFLLVLVLLLCGATGYFAYKTSEEVKSLREQLAVTESKVDSLMTATVKIAQSSQTSKSAASRQQPRSFWEELFSSLEEEQKKSDAQAKAKAAKEKVTVSASYRLEDRYVIGNVDLPDHLGTQTGSITINVTVNGAGTVKKTSVAEGATITDPEVIESVRKAALKTDFNSNFDVREQEGTITYTFKAK